MNTLTGDLNLDLDLILIICHEQRTPCLGCDLQEMVSLAMAEFPPASVKAFPTAQRNLHLYCHLQT